MWKVESTGQVFTTLCERTRTALYAFIRPRVARRLAVILLIIAALLFLSFLFRNPVLRYSLSRFTGRFNQAFHAVLQIDHIALRGFRSVEISGISLRPEGGEPLLSIGEASASISFWKLLAGRIALTDFSLRQADLHFVKRDSLTNYMFLLDRKSSGTSDAQTSTGGNYAMRMDAILTAVFDKIPDDLFIAGFRARSDYNGHLLSFTVDTLNIRDHNFSTAILVEEDDRKETWITGGEIRKSGHVARFSMFNAGGGKVNIPFLQYRWNAEVAFDTVRFSVGEQQATDGLVAIAGNAALSGLEVNHRRIAAEKVRFGDGSLDYSIRIGKDYYELDSTTTVLFNGLSVNPYLRYRPKPSKHVTLAIRKPDFPAQELFSALPPGLFHTLEGLQTRGNLNFLLYFDADLKRPDSLTFSCELDRRDFSITHYGSTFFGMINDTFTYTAYERGVPVRSFIVGPANPAFRQLDQISPYLRNAVLNSEDGGFFQHRGFLADAFRESIITNIREKRFARGGSTITMQLVKNVFLNRNKTIARKFEEVLIVWLMENLQLSSKERMFEVYLNIIEWGPLVYGAQEASQYYFAKDVSRLNLAEAIFLASIIPRPKAFMYSFDPRSGGLRDYLVNYYALMAGKMLRKEMISQQDHDELIPAVTLKGPANVLLKTVHPESDSAVIPDIRYNDME